VEDGKKLGIRKGREVLLLAKILKPIYVYTEINSPKVEK